jgi:hypothetical protein
VFYNFFLNIPSPSGEYLINEFKKYFKELDEDVFLFSPHYFFFEKPHYGNNTIPAKELNCLGSGRYCCYDPDGAGKATGADIVREQLRQLCVYEKYNTTGWERYMHKFHDECP